MVIMQITRNVPALYKAYQHGHRETSLGIVVDAQVTFDRGIPVRMFVWLARP